jgi:hypothetical protein
MMDQVGQVMSSIVDKVFEESKDLFPSKTNEIAEEKIEDETAPVAEAEPAPAVEVK